LFYVPKISCLPVYMQGSPETPCVILLASKTAICRLGAWLLRIIPCPFMASGGQRYKEFFCDSGGASFLLRGKIPDGGFAGFGGIICGVHSLCGRKGFSGQMVKATWNFFRNSTGGAE